MKVFGIGFQKTGTDSLGKAFEILGYKVCGCRGYLAENIKRGDLETVFNMAEQYSAFQDVPWAILYKELDRRFPNSKFILTIRDPDKWIKSNVNYFRDEETEMRKIIYGGGGPKGNEQKFLDRYNRHNREVVEYFKDRSNDLLVMDLARGDGWVKLCGFLGRDIPPGPFPNINKARYGLAGYVKWLLRGLSIRR